jgi:uncharacterized protein YlxW (UPF0749 family)
MATRGLQIGLILIFLGTNVFSQSSYDRAEELKSPQLRKEIAQLRAEVKRLKAKVERFNQAHKTKASPDSNASPAPRDTGNH